MKSSEKFLISLIKLTLWLPYRPLASSSFLKYSQESIYTRSSTDLPSTLRIGSCKLSGTLMSFHVHLLPHVFYNFLHNPLYSVSNYHEIEFHTHLVLVNSKDDRASLYLCNLIWAQFCQPTSYFIFQVPQQSQKQPGILRCPFALSAATPTVSSVKFLVWFCSDLVI